MSAIATVPCEGAFFEGLRAAPPPVAPARSCTAREFRERFTPAERGAITLAASQRMKAGDPTMQVMLDDLAASQLVELDHPQVRDGLDLLVAAGLISSARAAEILVP